MRSSFRLLALFLLASVAFGRQLSVVTTAPRGATTSIDQSQTILAVFNQPMAALQAVPSDTSIGPLRITPAVPGKYRWQGTSTITFIPAKNLPYATAFRVVIPAGTSSLKGQTLPGDVTWDFETPRPAVVTTTPYPGQSDVELDHAIRVRFNQPVDPPQVSRWISVSVTADGKTTYPPYTTARPTENLTQPGFWIVIRPNAPFPQEATVRVTFKAGLLGSEGPLGMVNDQSVSFTTHGGLKFVGVRNADGFRPNESLQLVFSTPVSRMELCKRLIFDPAMTVESPDYDWSERDIYLSLPLAAETQYSAMILPGVKDAVGNVLRDTVRFRFRTGSFAPSVRMVTGQGILEAYESHKYPVTFMNVDSVTLQMGRVDPERAITVMQRLDFSYNEEMMWNQAIVDYIGTTPEAQNQFSLSRVWRPRVMRNQATVRPIDLDEVLGSAKRGIVLVQLGTPTARRYQKALLQVTDIGLTAKFSPENSLVWVTKLKDASPVAGARVEVRTDSNVVVWSGTTDRNGLAMAPGWARLGLKRAQTNPNGDWYDSRPPRQWILVRTGDDVAFSSSDWNNGLEPWMFGVEYDWNPQPETMESEVFTDRGLYKAGEQVEMKGIVRVRSEGTWKIPKNADLSVSIKDSRYQEVLTARPQLNAFGSFVLSVPLTASAALGTYAVQVNAGGRQVGYGSFRVEAFRAAEFEVTAAIDGGPFVLGDTLRGFVSGRYLFGAPMKGAPVRWRLSSISTSWAPEGYDGYFFGPLQWLSRYERVGSRVFDSRDTVLDDQGSLRITGILGPRLLRGTQSVLLEADATSPSRQQISGRTSVLVHGGEFTVGVGLSGTFFSADSEVAMKFVAVDANSTPVAGADIEYRLLRRIWRSVRQAESGGRYFWHSIEEDTGVDSAAIRTGIEPLVRTFRPHDPGFYVVEARAKDRRGNLLLTNAYFYVSGNSYVPWERRDDDRIDLIADKQKYRPGETARIIVKSPYESAPALISVEREGIIRHFATTLTGSAPEIRIPLTAEDLPNVFVSVVLLQGRVEGAAATKESDVGRPSFKIGYVALPVSPDRKKLAVIVGTDRKEYRPGDSVAVTITTRSAGKNVPAEVTLSAADLGVLNLIAYRLPDPHERFYRPRGLAVTTTESRIHLVEQRNYDEKGEDAGGGGMEARAAADLLDADGVRKDFRPLAYWNPSIMTGPNGTATVRFKLPDNLTSFQVMAVGQTLASDFGYGEATLRVNKPLLLQPAFPRFARVGDRCEGGVVITNYTSAEKTVRLITAAAGVAFHGRDTMDVTLAAGQTKEVRHPFTADRLGTGTFVFRASTPTDRDGLQWQLPVLVPRRKEAAALYESTTDASVQERLQIPAGTYPDLGSVEFTAASTAMVGLSEGISYLFDYPYGCLEQRLSRVLPMILAKDLVSAFHLRVLEGHDHTAVVTQMLGEVPLFQRDDGGFSYWKNTDHTWPYLSAFTMLTLVEAKRNGYAVDKQMMDRGFSYLRDALNGRLAGFFTGEMVLSCTRALTLYALALNGTPDYGYMEKLYTERAQLPLFARAYLLRALHAANGNKTMIDELARDLMNLAKIAPVSAHFEERSFDDWYWVFHSNTRTTALVLEALAEVQPDAPILPKVVRWLLDQRKNGCWRTTQENLYVVDALATYFRTFEKDEPNFRAEIRLAGKTVLAETFAGRTLQTKSATLSLASLPQGVTQPVEVTRTGTGRLYYGMRLVYYPMLPVPARDEGIGIAKSVEGASEQPDGRLAVKAGTIVKVVLTITTNQQRQFVVIDDPLPAGLEAVNLSFATTATNLDEGTKQQDDWWWDNPFQHKEMRDDKVLFFAEFLPAGVHTLSYLARVTGYGTYAMPGTYGEEMYEPEVFGQTADRIVEVK